MAIGPNAGHGFLADVAALGETNRPLHSRHFLWEIGIVDVQPVNRRAGLDAKGVVRLKSGGSCPARNQGRPQHGGSVLFTEKVVSEHAQRLAAAKPAIDPRECLRRVLKLDKIRYSVPERLLEHGWRLWPGQVHLGEVVRPVRQFDLFGNEIPIQVLEDLFAHARSRVQTEQALALRKAAIDDDEGGNLRLGGSQERLAAGAGREVLHLIGTQVVQEARGIGSAGFHVAVMADVE
jgi:hypothetical protein